MFAQGVLKPLSKTLLPGISKRISQPLGASLRNRNAHGHLTKAVLCEFTGIRPRPRSATTTSRRACEIEMHIDISEEPFFARICKKNAAPQDHDAQFVWSCTVETILLENLQKKCRAPRSRRRLCASLRSRNAHGHVNFMRFYRENAAKQMAHPDLISAINPTVRTPQCGHTVWGKKQTQGMVHIYI